MFIDSIARTWIGNAHSICTLYAKDSESFLARLQGFCHLVPENGIQCTKQGVRLFLKRYRQYKTIARKPGSGLPPKLTPALQKLIEDEMQKNDETTATQLQAMLAYTFLLLLLSEIDYNLVGHIGVLLIASLSGNKTK